MSPPTDMPADPYRAPESATDVASSDDLLECYVGPNNTAWYATRFARFQEGGSAIGWHWPAFFVTGVWLLYRKMWLLAIGYWIVLPFVVRLVSTGLLMLTMNSNPFATIIVVNTVYFGFLFVVVPMFATHAYYRHARAKVEKVSQAFAAENERAAELSRIGGTSWIVPLVILVLFLGILAAIAIPAYQDYMMRAQMTGS